MLSQIGFNFCKDRNEHLINHHLESKWYIGGLGSGGLGFYGYSFHFTIPFTRGSFHCWIPSLTCSLLHLIQKNPPEKMAAILKVAMFLAIAFSFWLCVNFEKKHHQKKNPALNTSVFPIAVLGCLHKKITPSTLVLVGKIHPSLPHLTRPISTQGRSEAVGYCSLNSVGPSFAKFSERTFTVERRWFGWRKWGEMVWIKVQ